MADYYAHFSCILDVRTPENAARAIELYEEFSGDDAADMPLRDGFDLAIQGEAGTQLWMADASGGDPECVIRFVRLCAAEFGLTGSWGFAWTYTCSKPRLDGFGGGAHVLDLGTGQNLAWTDTNSWLPMALDGDDPDA